jgi:transposase
MPTFAGLDVSQAKTTVCIVDERGLVTWRGSCATSPRAIAQTLATRASSLERVGLESGPLAPWLVHELRILELPVVCLDARHARAALSVQINKSDANDADGLAQIVRTGWYREIEVKSVESHLVRATLGVRKQLVGMRTEMINQIRGLMKIFGLILPKGSGARFEASVRARFAEKAELGLVLEPLLAAWRALDDQVAALERQLVRRARRHEVCDRLMTVPGVGPLTALAFVTTVDDPTRFRRSSSVGAYLGLTPGATNRGSAT